MKKILRDSRCVFAFCDYDTLEVRTLAQTCIDFKFDDGRSYFADVIRSGKDVHLDMATETLGGMSYEDALERYEAGDKLIEDVRQGAKISVYGMSGGMGPDAFVEYARGYGVEVSRERAGELHKAYRRKAREMVEYFAHCSAMCADGGQADSVRHPRTGLWRGKIGYTQLANFYFQNLAAVGATDALFEVVAECVDPTMGSALYGCRPWLFNHDEIGMEIPYAAFGPKRAHAAAMRLQTVMIDRMSFWVPDVPIGATVAMARRWYKGAKAKFVDGLLVPTRKQGKVWVPDTDDLPGWKRSAA